MPSRAIDTGIWGEDGFARAGAIAKILFVRLVTGDDTGSAGALKTRAKRLAADLEGDGDEVTVEQIEEAIEQLRDAGLVRTYADGWIWLPKFIWWQAHSEGFLKSAERQAAQCPDSLARAIRRAVEKKRETLAVRKDRARTTNNSDSRENVEGSPKPRSKAPRAIASAKGQGKGSGAKALTPLPSSPQAIESAGSGPELDPSGARARTPEANGHDHEPERQRLDMEAIAAEAPPLVRDAILRARARAVAG